MRPIHNAGTVSSQNGIVKATPKSLAGSRHLAKIRTAKTIMPVMHRFKPVSFQINRDHLLKDRCRSLHRGPLDIYRAEALQASYRQRMMRIRAGAKPHIVIILRIYSRAFRILLYLLQALGQFIHLRLGVMQPSIMTMKQDCHMANFDGMTRMQGYPDPRA
jgi:hypothetical protein